jgi:hypothetical protein
LSSGGGEPEFRDCCGSDTWNGDGLKALPAGQDRDGFIGGLELKRGTKFESPSFVSQHPAWNNMHSPETQKELGVVDAERRKREMREKVTVGAIVTIIVTVSAIILAKWPHG